MPINLDDIPDDEPGRTRGGGGKGEGAAHRLFEKHPAGGGPYKGRDNALTAFVGLMRAKRHDYGSGLWFAQQWNREFCLPPLDPEDVREKVSRAWVEWLEGDEEDATPEDFKDAPPAPQSSILTVAELLAIARDPDRQLKWIAKNLIQEDGVTIISAPSGNGKTWLALDFCRHLSRGDDEEYGDWLDKYPLPRRRCLYMDEENGEPTLGERADKLGFKIENDRFFSWSDSGFRLENKKDRGALVKIAKERDIQVLVFDSLKAFHGRDENSATEMRKVGEWLREFVIAGFCVVVLHHDKKGNGMDGGTEQDKTRGSGDIVAFSQTVLGLVQKDEIFLLSQRKIRNAEKTGEVIPYILAADKSRPGGVLLDVEAARGKAEAEREQRREESLERKIRRVTEAIEILEGKGEPVTTRGIATVARMGVRDVTEARKSMGATSDRWDMED